MKSSQWRISIIISIFCIILIICVVIRITIESDYASDGQTLYQLQQQIKEVKKQNLLLKQELYTNESLTRIAQEAARMGFVPATQYIYIWPTLNNYGRSTAENHK